MEQPDLYRVLQVDSDADQDLIRSAYRALAAKHHPDVGGNGDEMAELNRAYAVLSDPVVRATYDRRQRARAAVAHAVMALGSSQADEPAMARATQDAEAHLDFGRYAGWSVAQVARHDPDFLEWFIRTPNGRRYHGEITRALHDMRGTTAS
jgi:DnaJ-class molecular chaperone